MQRDIYEKKKALAILVMALLMLLAPFVSARVHLAGQRAKALQMFEQGEYGDGVSIANDLAARAAQAANLLVIARRYVDESALRKVEQAREALLAADNPAQLYKANQALGEACDALDQALLAKELSAADERYRAGIRAELLSRANTIQNDGYNAAAAAYNKKVSGLPASLFCGVQGLGRLTLFAPA